MNTKNLDRKIENILGEANKQITIITYDPETRNYNKNLTRKQTQKLVALHHHINWLQTRKIKGWSSSAHIIILTTKKAIKLLTPINKQIEKFYKEIIWVK